jgi:Ca2+-transporting ATPase
VSTIVPAQPATADPSDVTAPTPVPEWHTQEVPAVAAALGVDLRDGLDLSRAASRLEEFGPNRLAAEKKKPKWLAFLDQFRNFLIIILIVAAVVSFLVTGELKTPVVILFVVLLNAVLGFVQENRAERSLDALRSMLVVTARVRRGGTTVEVDAQDLVPGDVVLVEAGDRIPADGRLLSATSLEVEEAALTGESAPVIKRAEGVVALDAPLGDRTNVVYMNTTVTRGRGELIVTGTGMNTEIGKIAGLLRSTEAEKTPLQKQLDQVAHVLAGLAGVVVVLVFAIGLIRGESFEDLFLTAVALAVASVPEGLPAVLAVTLALGAHQMAKRNAIVKRLASVETLGCTNVICSDKTGTLTLNQMTTRGLWYRGRHHTVSGEGYSTDGVIELSPDEDRDPVELRGTLLGFALCNDSVVRDGELVGDPTEGALTVVAAKGGVDVEAQRSAHPRLADVPFDSATKYMATFHLVHDDDGAEVVRMYVKGAPDVLLDRSATITGLDGRAEPLDAAGRDSVLAENDRFAAQGLRVLALARRDFTPEQWGERSGDTDDQRHALVADLQFEALAGILDPPRAEARDAIALCHKAGISVKMITGDHAATATAIARELGIDGDTVTGNDLDQMTDEELEARVDGIGVFARVAPEHKLKLVKMLQRRRNVVAMTGDGVNDAPALKQADIGVAMGITGTEVTKEAATMVLADDNFATIVGAVERGRTIYDNIVKFVRFQLSTTIGFGLTFLTASAFAIAAGKPFTALQILWVNIIMDGPPAMALGTDPPSKGVMERRPRAMADKILNPSRVARLLFLGIVMAVGALGVMITAPDYVSGEPLAGTVAMTMAFTTFVFFQFFNLVNCRAEYGTAFNRGMLTNRTLWIIIAVVVVLQVGAVHLPFLQTLFDTTGLTAAQWGICVAVASSILWLEEIRKLVARVVLSDR